MRVRPQPRTFQVGELAPYLDGLNNELTQKAALTLTNYYVKKSGIISRRPGAMFVSNTKYGQDKNVRLIPCEIDDDHIYCLEVGDHYIRFIKNDYAQVKKATLEANTWQSCFFALFSGDHSESYIFLAVASDGTNRIAWSADGEQWNAITAPEANPWQSGCYNNDLIRAVAVASTGTHRVMSTGDGKVWTSRTAAEANTWISVCSSPIAPAAFTAVAADGTNRVMISADGYTWQSRASSEQNYWRSICYGDTPAIFVAVSSDGAHRVMTSVDGSTWLPQSAAETKAYYSACWSNAQGIFVAVGDNAIMRSSNGVNWFVSTCPEANTWFKVTYNTNAGLFVAISTNGTHRVMTSVNGVNWTLHSTVENNIFRSLATTSLPCMNSEDWPIKYVTLSIDGTNRSQSSLDAALWSTPPYEVYTPWGEDDLAELRWEYSPKDKSLIFTHPDYPSQRLVWTADDDWTLETTPILTNKPYLWHKGRVIGKTDDLVTFERIQFPVGSGYTGLSARGSSIYGEGKYLLPIIMTTPSNAAAIYSSTDLETWVDVTPTEMQHVSSLDPMVRYGSSQFLCGLKVYHADGNELWVSPNGLSWSHFQSSLTLPSYIPYYAHNKSTGYWRIGGGNRTSYSEDTMEWTLQSLAASITIYGIGCNPNTSLWLMPVLRLTAGPGIYSASNDVASLTFITAPVSTGTPVTIAYGKPGGVDQWVYVHSTATTGSLAIWTSSTGAAWTAATTIPSVNAAGYLGDLVWDGQKYILSVWNGYWSYPDYQYSLLKSTDGDVWELISPVNAEGYSQVVRSVAVPDICNDLVTTDHYPKDIAYHEGRLVFAEPPATLWGSKINSIYDFYAGENADEAWSYDLLGEQNVDIVWVMGESELVVGTRTAEGVMRGSQDTGITPLSAHFSWQSTFGSENIKPVRLGNMIIFVQCGGKIIRGYVSETGTQSYLSPDLTENSDHLFAGYTKYIKEMVLQTSPQNVLYCLANALPGLAGKNLFVLTHDGQIHAWSRYESGDDFISLAVTPHPNKINDVWCIVDTPYPGNTRYICAFDPYHIDDIDEDSYVDYFIRLDGANSVTVTGLDALEGQTVTAQYYTDADGCTYDSGLVVTAGTITLTRAAKTGRYVFVGLPFTSTATSMRINPGSQWGSSSGLLQQITQLDLWLWKSRGGKCGPDASHLYPIPYSTYLGENTAMVKVPMAWDWDTDGYVTIVQDAPFPLNVTGFAPDVQVGEE